MLHWRHALRSEWPFIIIINAALMKRAKRTAKVIKYYFPVSFHYNNNNNNRRLVTLAEQSPFITGM